MSPGPVRKPRRSAPVPATSPFAARVYELVSAVPEGSVVTYGAVARALRSSPRAVGQALRHNPFAPVVPCHRVVAADRRLGGFNGHVGDCAELRRKRAMLEAEGVKFIPDGRVHHRCLHQLDEAPAV
eukprot:EG_transcript_30190